MVNLVSRKMAKCESIWPLHQAAESFILQNISRLPDDYLEFPQKLEETVITTYENEIRRHLFHCNAESQGLCNHVINYDAKTFNVIVTGSSVEGLCMDNILHYPSIFSANDGKIEETDLDCMMIDRRFVATEKLDREVQFNLPMKLKLETAKHHPGYCSLIIDKMMYNGGKKGIIDSIDWAIIRKIDQQSENTAVFANYVTENEDQCFFSSQLYSAKQLQLVKSINPEAREFYKHGPALTLKSEENVSLDVIADPQKPKFAEKLSVTGFDMVPALEVEHWPEISVGWGSRERHWPELEVVKDIMRSKCHLVPVPHHHSSCTTIEWRLSFSVAEKELARHFTKLQRQMYIFVKYILWRDVINKNKTLSSYHFKTAFFWLMEDLPFSFWKEDNFSQIVHLLLEKLALFLLENNWPNYFVPSNNMIGHLKKEDLEESSKNLQAVKEDILSCVLSCSSDTNPLILEEHIFKSVFKPIFTFMQMDNSLSKYKDIGDLLEKSLDDEFLDDESWDDDELTGDEWVDGEWLDNEIETQVSPLRTDEAMETEEGKGWKSGQKERICSGECEGNEGVKKDKMRKEMNKGQTGSCEREKMNRFETEEYDKKQERTIGHLPTGRDDFNQKDETIAIPSEDSNEKKPADANLLSKYNTAKATSLLNIAKIYQMFHSFDFSLQIFKELYEQRDEDELTLTSFITEASLKGATAETEAIENIIELHEYLLSSSFQNNPNINLSLSYLHLCLASVSHGTGRNKAIETAVTYLDANKFPSIEGDILRARIEAVKSQYESAQKILGNSYASIKESNDLMYVSINPVEYMLLPEGLRDVINSFAYGPDCPTNVPINLYVLFLMAYYQSKVGMKEEIGATCKEFNSQLKLEQMDVYDQQLGEAMFSILLNLQQGQTD